MNFRLGLLLVISALLCSCDQDKKASIRPNVIMILADDQGWGDLSIHGNPYISTPNIDQLAKNGAQFSHFYVQPVCSPTRAELLTGRYHARTGVYSTSAGGERIDLDETLVSEIFQESGYRTGCFGKWHSGSQHPYHPNSRGFDEYYGFTSGHWGHYFSPQLDHNGSTVTGNGYLPDDLTDQLIAFFSGGDEPFFAFLPLNTPHSPMQVPDKYWAKFEDVSITEAPSDSSSQNHARAALAMVENIDWNIGRIVQALKEQGRYDQTIILYMTDNGPNGQRWNGGMKGRKGSTDEGGVRSPLFVQWPGNIRPGLEIREISAGIDITPTLMDLCNISSPVNLNLDGKSLAPLLLEDPVVWPERFLVQHWRGRTSIRTPQYRLDHEHNLYDITADPTQQTDISDSQEMITSQLVAFKQDWERDILSELPEEDQRPYPIGHPDFSSDYLPARDGIPHGSVKRSNRYPNDSYFTNWTNESDSITWEIEVLEPGIYEFHLHYTMIPSDAGVLIQMTVGGHSLITTVDTPFTSSLVGSADDRVPRIESYVKEFTTHYAGQLDLSAGKQTIKLKAHSIPGINVMDLYRVSVIRM